MVTTMTDYIEREALLSLKEEMWQDRCDHMVVRVTNIMNIPAADVAPVVHGRWEVYLDGKYLMCSACKASFWDENGDGGTNYCPNCGAKMDGKSNVPRTEGE